MSVTTYRAQVEALLATGVYPGDAQAAAEIGCSPITAQDCRQRYQRANGTQHKNNSGIMPREVVDFVFDLRNEGLAFKEIAQRVNREHGAYYGIHVTAGQCGSVYRRHGYTKPAPSRVIDYLGSYAWGDAVLVPLYTFPIETTVGIMEAERIVPPKFPRIPANKWKCTCDFCPHLEHCLAHPGDICRCETAREDEVII